VCLWGWNAPELASQCPYGYANQVPPKYKSEALLLQRTCSCKLLVELTGPDTLFSLTVHITGPHDRYHSARSYECVCMLSCIAMKIVWLICTSNRDKWDMIWYVAEIGWIANPLYYKIVEW
jgi:hypothetical protein